MTLSETFWKPVSNLIVTYITTSEPQNVGIENWDIFSCLKQMTPLNILNYPGGDWRLTHPVNLLSSDNCMTWVLAPPLYVSARAEEKYKLLSLDNKYLWHSLMWEGREQTQLFIQILYIPLVRGRRIFLWLLQDFSSENDHVDFQQAASFNQGNDEISRLSTVSSLSC